VNTGIVLVHPSQFVVKGQSVLYSIPVLRIQAKLSVGVVVDQVAFVFLQFEFVSLKLKLGIVLSIIKSAVSAVLFNQALSYTVILSLIVHVLALIPELGVIHKCSNTSVLYVAICVHVHPDKYSNTFCDKKLSVHHVRVIVYHDPHLKYTTHTG
jgi:hypothetical protein